MTKYAFGGGSMYNKGSNERLLTTIFYDGYVVSNVDELGGNRIKVRISGVDKVVTDIATDDGLDLPYAFPMLQKFLHVVPKVGETVWVFIPDIKNPNINRLYLGPIISQPQKLLSDNEPFSAKSLLSSGFKEPDPSPFRIPENKGVYPRVEDIALQGRNNSDIILKEKEILLRAGQFNSKIAKGEIPLFNKINPSYIQIKHDVTLKPATDTTAADVGGVINIVSNKINLLTHKNGNPRFSLNNQDSMVSDEEIQKIVKDAHPMVFGDNLIELIKILINAFINHVHAFPGLKPQDLSGANDIDKLLEYDLNSILSKNIRIN